MTQAGLGAALVRMKQVEIECARAALRTAEEEQPVACGTRSMEASSEPAEYPCFDAQTPKGENA